MIRSILYATDLGLYAPYVLQHALTLADGRQFSVIFAPGDAITAQPIGRPELPAATHPYIATVRLIEI